MATVWGHEWLVRRALDGELGEWAAEDILREGRPLEWIQVSVLALAFGAGVGCFRRGGSPLHRILCLLLLGALCRELDSFWGDLIYEGFHFVPAALVLIGSLYLMSTRWAQFTTSFDEFQRRPSFLLFLFGGVLAGVIAQSLGVRDIWKLLAPEETTIAKRFVEEGLELPGYLFLLFGMLEERLYGGAGGRRSENAGGKTGEVQV